MGNNNQNGKGNGNNNGGNKYNVPAKLSLDELRSGLFNLGTNLNLQGLYFTETTDTLMQLAEATINDLGLTQIDRVMIKPAMRRGDKNVVEAINAAASFDLLAGNDIRSNTNDNGNNADYMARRQMMLWKASGINKHGGDFYTSTNFKTIMGAIAQEFTDNDDIVIRKPPANYGKNVGVVVVDFMELMRLMIGMKEDDPYNFRIMNVTRLNQVKYQFDIVVYLDTNSRRKKGRRGGNVDYQGMTDYLFS